MNWPKNHPLLLYQRTQITGRWYLSPESDRLVGWALIALGAFLLWVV